MSARISIDNFGSVNIKETSELTADAASGQPTIAVKNTQTIAVNDYVLVGTVGGEKSELRKVQSISGGTGITFTANLTQSHARFEPITVLFGDKIKLYRAANVDGSQPADGSFSVVGTTTDIDPDQLSTDITDSSGSSSYWYKATFYNSTTTSETDIAASSAARGGGYGNYCSIDLIRKEAGLATNRWISDSDIDTKRRAAQDEINGVLTGLYTVPFDPVPPKVQQITAELAAGLLLTSSLFGNYVNLQQRGEAKLKSARDELQKIKEKQQSLVVNGETVTTASVGGFAMYPDADTDGLEHDEGGPRFTVGMRY